MRTHVITAITAALVGMGAMALAQPDQYSQQSFPCQEDEVLTYSPQFGPERVGCVHYEDIGGK